MDVSLWTGTGVVQSVPALMGRHPLTYSLTMLSVKPLPQGKRVETVRNVLIVGDAAVGIAEMNLVPGDAVFISNAEEHLVSGAVTVKVTAPGTFTLRYEKRPIQLDEAFM